MEQVARIKLKAVLENVPAAIDFVTEAVQLAELDDRTLYLIQLAVDEVTANVVHHAYEGAEPGDMEISCSVNGRDLSIRVRDWGKGFVIDQVSHPDVHAPLEERTLGGLGLFLVKQVMDQVDYARAADGFNELVMTKRLHSVGQ